MKSNELITTIENIVNNFKILLDRTESMDILKNVQDLQTNGVPALIVLSDELTSLSYKSEIEHDINSLEIFFNEIVILQQRFNYLKQLYYSKFPSEISETEKEQIKQFMESLENQTDDLDEQLHIDADE